MSSAVCPKTVSGTELNILYSNLGLSTGFCIYFAVDSYPTP